MDTIYSKSPQLERMLANILSIVVIFAIAFPVTGNVSAQEPTFPEGFHDGMEGTVNAAGCAALGWTVDPDDRERDLQVQILSDGSPVATTTADLLREDVDACTGGTCGFSVNLWGLISAGEEHQITAQAYDEETSTWVDLSGTPKSLTCWGYPEGFHDGMEGVVEANNCSVFGWAVDPDERDRDMQIRVLSDGEQVKDGLAQDYGEDMEINNICPGGTCRFTLDLWSVISPDEAHEINVQAYDEETSSWVELSDTPKLLTCQTPPPPTPWFTVFLEQGVVEGWNWPLDAVIHLAVDDPGTEVSPDFAKDGTMVLTPWDPDSGVTWLWIDFSDAYSTKPGDVITLTDGITARIHVVHNLTITEINPEENTVFGTTDPGQVVTLWSWEGGWLETTADESGNWNADFDNVGFDLVPGYHVRAEVWDDDGNDTAVDRYIPNPHFTVFPDWEWFDGLDWSDGAIVSIGVEGKPECTLERESWGGFFNGSFPEGCSVEAGDTVTFDDGNTNRWHTVRNLYVTDVGTGENTVAGKADAGETVYVWPHDGWFEPLQTTVDETGIWQVDFDDAEYFIREDSEGRSEIRDEMGNATASDWHVTHPHFTVFPEWEWFDGLDWPNEATITITVADKPECETTKESWGYFFNGSFGDGCDLEIGDTVTFTDGDTIRTHTVQNLTVTKTNHEDDTIKGIADPGAEVYVWPHATGEQQLAIAKTNGTAKGKWNADFSGIFDLVLGDCGRSEVRDEDANSTAVDWCIPKPTFVAYMSVTIVGYDWPIGDTIDISINDGEYAAQATVGNADWDPTVALFELWRDDFIMEAGDHIVMTDEAAGITKEVWVTNLTATDFDLNAEKVFGIHDPAYDLWVWLYDLEGQVPEIDSDNGTWVATFTELPPGAWGGATQWDADGDGTSIDFQVPNTRVVIDNQPDWVDSGITVNAGQSFTIEAFGLMNPCSDTYPDGADICIFYTPLGAEGVVPDQNEFGFFPGPGLRFMALLGRIGDGEPFFIGEDGTFTAEQAGTLWLTPNDNLRTDNQGAHSVLVWLEP